MPDHDYIPGGAADFNQWQDTFTKFAESFMEGWNMSQTALDKWQLLTNTAGKKKKRWEKAWKIVSSKACTKGDRQELKDARRDYERGLSSEYQRYGFAPYIAEFIRYNPKVKAEQKRDMRLTVEGDLALPSAEATANSDEMQVTGSVVLIKHLLHKSSVRTIGSTKKGKGKGIADIEIFIAFTEAKVMVAPPIKEFVFDGDVNYGSYVKQFTDEQEGMRCWYYARKVIRRGKRILGPPSAPWSGLIW